VYEPLVIAGYTLDSTTIKIREHENHHREREAIEVTQAALEQISKDFHGNINIITSASTNPKEALYYISKTHGVDKLVVGTRKLSRLYKLFIGSTSAYLSQNVSHCEVIVA